MAWINEIAVWKDAEVKSLLKQRVFSAIGVAYMGIGRFDEAEKAFISALRIGPDLSSLRNNMGTIYYKRGMMDDAAAEYLSAIKIRPDSSLARKNLGVAYERLGRFDEAIKEYDSALSFEPDYGEKGQYAEIHYNHYNRGNAYAMKGFFNRAMMEDYEIALKILPYHVQARNNLGLSYLELGQLDRAEEELKKAIAFYPDYFDAHYNIALVYVKKGMLNEALPHFEKALALDPRQDKMARAIQEIKEFFSRQSEKAL